MNDGRFGGNSCVISIGSDPRRMLLGENCMPLQRPRCTRRRCHAPDVPTSPKVDRGGESKKVAWETEDMHPGHSSREQDRNPTENLEEKNVEGLEGGGSTEVANTRSKSFKQRIRSISRSILKCFVGGT